MTQFSNYRPISLLPSLSKIFEKVIYHQLFAYLNDEKLFCIEQYGFRKGHSTELAAMQLIDHLTNQVDKRNIPINVYIDLSKAVDTLNHGILLDKLNYYGICGIANGLLQNYLTNRQQYVDYEGTKSASKSIRTGVPQGSILGPLLFLVYINDLPTISPVFNMLMYADDTTLHCNITHNISEQVINDELIKVQEWLSSNKLALNISKTKYMVFHTSQKKVEYPKLKLNNITIQRVSQFNILGLIINSSLKWNSHIDHISKKISRVIGIMYRLKHIYPPAILLTLYNTLIVPHYSYCLLTWGCKITANHSLHLLQKRALRIITDNDYIAHSEIICKALYLVQVPDMYRLTLWKFYFNLMNNKLPSYFECMKPQLPIICDLYECRRPNFHLPTIRLELSEQLVNYQLTKLLNNERGSLVIISKVHTHSFKSYKYFIKKNVIDSYLDHCNIHNCYSCESAIRKLNIQNE